ncbi:hypothetical protein U0035_15080 [Niabella yanshanensis]|uniref:Uncharacterized protein n=1 Tax=Niabella yanshanensis TaxID=577386 RepID=A0ABZ0W163_9BACT|nr:hypothetical protein [Niabella yanshanensis]WQD36995.1 hypothetical protein U0035_15080 [Niabella yanshanensis]
MVIIAAGIKDGFTQALANDVGYATDATADEHGLATMGDYEHWKNATFRVSEYDNIPANYKRAIVKIFMDNKYYDNDEPYHLTSIKDRAPKIYAFGNFTGTSQEGKPDMAFLLEKQDFQSSALFIISSLGDILYWKEYSSDLPIVNAFKKGSKIFIDTPNLEPSPLDGIIIQFKYSRNALVYNSQLKTFEPYHQYTKEELGGDPEEGDEPDVEPEAATKQQPDSSKTGG